MNRKQLEEKIIIIKNPDTNQKGYRWRQPVIKNKQEQYIDIKKINLEEYDINNNIINFITINIEDLKHIRNTINIVNPRNHHKENRIVKISRVD